MKKIIATLLVAALAVCGFASCGDKEPDSTSATTTALTTIANTTVAAADTTKAPETDVPETTAPVTESQTTPETPATTSIAYSIDSDITIVDGNAGIVFAGLDPNNFLMWQLAIGEHDDGHLYFRPHSWTGGNAACLKEVVIDEEIEALSGITVDYGVTYHMTINIMSDYTIVTLINNVQVDVCEDMEDCLDLDNIGALGFRVDAYMNGTQPEIGIFDNIVVKTGAGVTLLNETFDSEETMFCASLKDEFPDQSELTDGALKVSGKMVYMTGFYVTAD